MTMVGQFLLDLSWFILLSFLILGNTTLKRVKVLSIQ